MKKSIKIIASLLSLAVVGTGATFAVINSQGLDYDIGSIKSVGSSVEIVSEEIDSITIKKNDGNFKVLMFTDVHLNRTKEDNDLALNNLVKNIAEQKPDLVIFGGDTVFCGFSRKITRDFAEIMEKTGVYWTAVLGNHDGEGFLAYSRKEIIDLYSSYEHCLLKQGREDVDGNGNCTINILNADNTLKEVFFLLDSGDYMTLSTKKQYNVKTLGEVYDGVKESQVQWYKEKHDEIQSKYGEFKSIAIQHIPPYQCGDAQNYEFLYGEQNENACESGFDSGLIDAFVEKGSTQAVYFGHDHINNFGFMYKNVLLSYIQSSGYGTYTMKSSFNSPESEWLQGLHCASS